MTTIAEPPEGWEIQPSDADEPLRPEDVRFTGPNGEVKTLQEMVDDGLIPATPG